ncbi:hypothetical protein PLICRDRAFT_484859 [Plicaturopsis crispa FD-325 SS-3]|nr:hypothetical protein PLICRDRAFT_484859 [Plicaturopsis crispa FD-325 SS-3]
MSGNGKREQTTRKKGKPPPLWSAAPNLPPSLLCLTETKLTQAVCTIQFSSSGSLTRNTYGQHMNILVCEKEFLAVVGTEGLP